MHCLNRWPHRRRKRQAPRQYGSVPSRGWASLQFDALWHYRELLYFLVWRDVKVRYKQTVLGIMWIVLQPLVTIVVFSALFGNLLGVPSGGVPYPIFLYAALLPWQYFAGSLTRSSTNLVANAHLITKVYFPRLILPMSAVLSGLVDFAVAFCVFAGLMLYFGIAPTLAVLTLPLFLLLAMITALGFGLWLSALNVRYRDINHLVPFIVQIWMYVTPVIYPSTLIPGAIPLAAGPQPHDGCGSRLSLGPLGRLSGRCQPARIFIPGLDPDCACRARRRHDLLPHHRTHICRHYLTPPLAPPCAARRSNLDRFRAMGDIAIRVDRLSKQYRIGQMHQHHDTLRDAIAAGVQNRFRRFGLFAPSHSSNGDAATPHEDTIWALKDLSFEVRRGEVIGIIGRNGAGKSTLLKILSRITEPTHGFAELHGRVGSLLEVGTGFHNELSGRENVYLSGAILGMRKQDIERRFDEIVDFSGVEKFIDTPVKRYSSGMKVRLGFAVAAHLEPEILLVDEVLAVGDAGFQKKCLGKMHGVAVEGRTVVFVSHNMTAMQFLCPRAILLDQGLLVVDGKTDSTIGRYIGAGKRGGQVFLTSDTSRRGSGTAVYESVRIVNEFGDVTDSIPMNGTFAVEMRFRCRHPLDQISFGVAIRGSMHERICQILSRVTHGEMPPARTGGAVHVWIQDVNLLPGLYFISVGMSRQGEQIDYVENALSLEIVPHDVYGTGKIPESQAALVYLPCTWKADYC